MEEGRAIRRGVSEKADTPEKDNGKRALLLQGKPLQLMLKLSLPGIIGMVVVGLYSFMDGIFVGQLVGATAMGAVAMAYPLTFVNGGLSSMIGMGSASVLSRAVGRKDQATIDKIAGNLVMMNIIIGFVVTIIGVVFARQLMSLLGAQGEILDMGEHYVRIIFMGSFFVTFGSSANMIMRGEGEMVKAMTIMGASALLNIALSPIFILMFRDSGAGVEGAAIATVVSQIMLAATMVWWFVKKEKVARIHAIKIDRRVFSEVMKVGVSAFLMQFITIIQQAVIYNAAGAWGGDTWQILFGAALRYQAFGFIPLWGVSQGFQPVAGTNYGAKLYDRVRQMTKTFALGATALALIFWVPAMIAPSAVLSMFITDPDMVALGAGDFRILMSVFFLYGFMIVGMTLLQALGKGGKAAFLGIARPLLFFVPLVLIVPNLFGLGVHGIWIGAMLSDLLISLITIAFIAIEFKAMRSLAAVSEVTMPKAETSVSL